MSIISLAQAACFLLGISRVAFCLAVKEALRLKAAAWNHHGHLLDLIISINIQLSMTTEGKWQSR